MKFKIPKPTKTDMIRFYFNQWDPLKHVEKAGPMFYNYEAEDLAQRIRKNSRPEKIAETIQELMTDKASIESFDVIIEEEECGYIAALIHAWMKGQ